MTDERLKPARPPEEGGKPEYAPRFPWRWVVLGFAALSILGGGYYLREQSKEQALREQIQQAYTQQLGPVVDRYRGFRDELEDWVVEAAEEGPPARYVDPRLRIAALHQGQGLYLRLRADQARTKEGIEEAALQMGPDAITRCLGISPISVKGFYEKGAFLMPGWIDRAAEDRAGMMRLRVIDDELARFGDRDLPPLLNMMQSQYFLLVIERGETRAAGPVDVFLYDLRGDRKLLSLRTEPEGGVLIPVRIATKGAPAGPRAALPTDSPGAADCSIAAQMKELTGEPAMDFGSEVARPAPAEVPAEASEEPEAATEEGEVSADPPAGEPGEPAAPAGPQESQAP